MRLDNVFICFSLLFIFMYACTSIEDINNDNSCLIFNEKKIGINQLRKVTKNGERQYPFNCLS